MDVKKIREAIEKIDLAHDEVSAICKGKRWLMSIPANRITDSDLIINDALLAAREALALLDAPVASDARELARKVYDNYGHNDNNAVERIESFASARERKAREETARKCADNYCRSVCAWPSTEWKHPDECECAQRSAIMEAAHE